MSSIRIYVISLAQLARNYAWKKLSHWTLHADFSVKFFYTCHALGTVHLGHFMPLSVSLTLAGGHKVSAK